MVAALAPGLVDFLALPLLLALPRETMRARRGTAAKRAAVSGSMAEGASPGEERRGAAEGGRRVEVRRCWEMFVGRVGKNCVHGSVWGVGR